MGICVWSITSETTQRSVLVGGSAQQFQPLLADPLETVGRSAGFESSAAQDARAIRRHGCGNAVNLLGAFHAARPGHHHHFLAPDGDPRPDGHQGSLRAEMPAGQLIGRGNSYHLFHAVQQLDVAGVEIHLGAHRPQHRMARTRGAVYIKPHIHQAIDDILYVIFRRAFLHHHYHKASLLSEGTSAVHGMPLE